MRLTDHTENPILSTCLAWFGGGGSKGPSAAEKKAAADQQAALQAQAAQQSEYQKQQLALAQQSAADQKKAQQDMLAKMEANKPAPAAQVDPGNPQADVAAEAARRRGLRKSILAGESSQAVMGSSTLG
jgi:hypothetical protein